MFSSAKSLPARRLRLLLHGAAEEPLLILCRGLCAAALLRLPMLPVAPLLLCALLPWSATQVRHAGRLHSHPAVGAVLLAAEVWLLLCGVPAFFLSYLFLPILLLSTAHLRRLPRALHAVLHAAALSQCCLAPAYCFDFTDSPLAAACNLPVLLGAGLLFLATPLQSNGGFPLLPRTVLHLCRLLLLCLCALAAYTAAAAEQPLFLWLTAEAAVLTGAEWWQTRFPRTAAAAGSYLPLMLAALPGLFYGFPRLLF